MDEEPKETAEIRGANGRFLPGNPGSPGRPPGTFSLVSLLKEHLKEVPDGEKRTRAELFIQKTLSKAMRGDPGSEKLVWNYVEGLPQGSLDVTTGGKPITDSILNVLHNDRDEKDLGTQQTP